MSENNLSPKYYEGKPCVKCGSIERYVNGKNCVNCTRKQSQEWARDNPEKSCGAKRKWAKVNQEKHSKQKQKWAKENSEKRRNINQNWYQKNSRKKCEQTLLWQQINSKKNIENHRKWKRNNPGKCLEYGHRQRVKRAGAEGSYLSQAWIDLKEQYNNRCLDCGVHESELATRLNIAERHLTPDHIIPLSRGGTDYITNIQPLCFPCNRKNWHHYLKTGSQIDYRFSSLYQ
jgi:hypothetical protein